MNRLIHKVAFILHSWNAAIVTKWVQNTDRPLSFKRTVQFPEIDRFAKTIEMNLTGSIHLNNRIGCNHLLCEKM